MRKVTNLCWAASLVTSSTCLTINSLPSSSNSQGEATDHVHILIFCHGLFWAGKCQQSPSLPGSTSSDKWWLQYAATDLRRCWFSCFPLLTHCLENLSLDEQPFQCKKIVILQEFMILIRLMSSTQVLFHTMLRLFPQCLKLFSQSSWILPFSVALYWLLILQLRNSAALLGITRKCIFIAKYI